MNAEKVVVLNTDTEEVGEIRRSLFDNPVFNPNGLLVIIEDTRSGCVGCGVEPSHNPDEVSDSEEDDDSLEDETLDEEED